MSYGRLIIERIRELEEDTVITNPKARVRTFLHKLGFRHLVLFDKLRQRLRGSRRKRADQDLVEESRTDVSDRSG